MRKVLGLLVAAVFVVSAASSVFALGVGKSTQTARIAFSGPGEFSWDVTILNVSDNLPPAHGEIRWATTVTPGSGWQNATQYVKIVSTVTDAKSYIRVYTDNVNGTEFKFTGTAREFLGGLVCKNNPSATPLSMAWVMKDALVAGGATVNPVSTVDSVKFASSYFLDASNSDFNAITGTPGASGYTNNIDYSTIINANGWKWTSAPTGGLTTPPTPSGRGGSGSGTFFMYIGAEFGGTTPNEYGCDTVMFHGITEP